MELDEKQLIIGFNHGYLIAKHEPKLLSLLLRDIKPENSFVHGMKSGQTEYELEQQKNKLQELTQLRNKNIERERE